MISLYSKYIRENKNFEYQFFSNKFKESHHKWKDIYKKLKDNQKILHNISYNYWKRSYQSLKFTK